MNRNWKKYIFIVLSFYFFFIGCRFFGFEESKNLKWNTPEDTLKNWISAIKRDKYEEFKICYTHDVSRSRVHNDFLYFKKKVFIGLNYKISIPEKHIVGNTEKFRVSLVSPDFRWSFWLRFKFELGNWKIAEAQESLDAKMKGVENIEKDLLTLEDGLKVYEEKFGSLPKDITSDIQRTGFKRVNRIFVDPHKTNKKTSPPTYGYDPDPDNDGEENHYLFWSNGPNGKKDWVWRGGAVLNLGDDIIISDVQVIVKKD